MKITRFDSYPKPFLVFILIIISFFTGAVFRSIYNHKSIEEMPYRAMGLRDKFNGAVYSTNHIARQIEKYIYLEVPSESVNLYFAISPSFKNHYYAALTLPTEQACEKFLETQLGVPFVKFESDTVLPEIFAKKGPGSWVKNLRLNWDLDLNQKFYICKDTGYGNQMVVYIPKHRRIFIHSK